MARRVASKTCFEPIRKEIAVRPADPSRPAGKPGAGRVAPERARSGHGSARIRVRPTRIRRKRHAETVRQAHGGGAVGGREETPPAVRLPLPTRRRGETPVGGERAITRPVEPGKILSVAWPAEVKAMMLSGSVLGQEGTAVRPDRAARASRIVRTRRKRPEDVTPQISLSTPSRAAVNQNLATLATQGEALNVDQPVDRSVSSSQIHRGDLVLLSPSPGWSRNAIVVHRARSARPGIEPAVVVE